MDRIEAMTAFVGTVDQGSLAGASRRLGCSPAAVTRAIAGLERLFGTRLLHRTTRAIKLTEAGERYAASCRRILADLQEAELTASGERPRRVACSQSRPRCSSDGCTCVRWSTPNCASL